MSVSNSTVNRLKESKKSIVFSQNSTTSGALFKYLCGNTLVYNNYTLEDNGQNSQFYQSGSEVYLKSTQLNLGTNTFIRSKGLTGDQGYTVGYPITKDMDTTDEPDELSSDYAPFNVPISGAFETSYWRDWGNDIFDGFGFFYIFDVATQQYYFPILSPENLADGTFTTQNFSAFGRTYTITHGYPAEGIFKFDISCSDNSEFIFGAYGDMGSDDDTENTNLTQNYTLNGGSFTLYYNRNIESGDSIERLFSYFIPYESQLNNIKTYSDFLTNEDELSLYSVPVRSGLTVYFSKKNDVKDWVINDLTLNQTNLRVSGDVLVSGTCLSRLNLTTLDDSDYTADAQELIEGYFITQTLTNNRSLIIPSASSIIAAINNCQVGTSFRFTVNNVQSNYYARILQPIDGSIVLTNVSTNSIIQNNIITYIGYVSNINSGSEQVLILQESHFNTIVV